MVRGRYAVANGERFKWMNRWFKVPPLLMKWINQNTSAVSDIDVLFQENPAFADLRENPVVKQYQDLKAHSFVRAMLKENSRPACSLSLACKSEAPRQLSDTDQETLDRLGLAETLRLVRAAYQAEAAEFRQEIRDLFSRMTSPEKVAVVLVKRLCEHFDWISSKHGLIAADIPNFYVRLRIRNFAHLNLLFNAEILFIHPAPNLAIRMQTSTFLST